VLWCCNIASCLRKLKQEAISQSHASSNDKEVADLMSGVADCLPKEAFHELDVPKLLS
jgi:hypothetical protein